VVDELRDTGERVGLLKILSFRPFPAAAVADALAGVEVVTVLDRADSPGGTPPLHADVAAALYGSGSELRGSVYGLGGRDLHPQDVRAVFDGAAPAHIGLRGEPCPV
jgi:pyruvate ferredoxin oxidoreductase alpha subunit